MKLKNYTSGVPVDRSVWADCYSEGWGDRIVPDAFSHPAKMSYNLLVRILGHAKEQGWISKGDLVLDPFGGIASTGIVGAYQGYRVVCCELEPKFVDLANQNFALHRGNWQTLGVPFPVIIQGDSRRLSEVLRGADCLISSPPYAESATAKNSSGIDKHKQWETYRSQGGGLSYEGFVEQQERHCLGYGSSPGQLGAMKAGDLVISSPPYIEPPGYGGKPSEIDLKKGTGGDLALYGKTDGQLGSMPPGDLIVSSPPYEGSGQVQKSGIKWDLANRPDRLKPSVSRHAVMGDNSTPLTYGESENQLGNSQGDTFWTAAREIVQECYKILRPGGHAVWIVKAFVRNKKIVDFPGDWQRLCEDVGFKTVCTHHAMLVKSHNVGHLFDGEFTKKTERKSFFRRLAESKGSPRIDFETVLCQLK